MKRLITAWIFGFFLAVTAVLHDISTIAGPVARELLERRTNVGIPKARPPSRTNNSRNINNADEILDHPDAPPAKRSADEEPDAILKTAETPDPASEKSDENTNRFSACLLELKKIARADRTTSPNTNDPKCVIPDPVILHRTNSRFPVNFTAGLTLDCPFALSVARFTDDTAQALARYHLGTAIDTILSGEGFICRRRNNAATGKLSEHAFGNATDWSGFKFADGGRLSIRDSTLVDEDEGHFLNSLRRAACGTFTTVLGPGSDAAQANHFHFDLGRAKDRKNPYRICE